MTQLRRGGLARLSMLTVGKLIQSVDRIHVMEDRMSLKKEQWDALGVRTFGLQQDLFVPIAARNVEEIEAYVGKVNRLVYGRKRPVNAVLVEAVRPEQNDNVPLWREPEATTYYQRLHPPLQLWVHVDYRGYRAAWKRLGLSHLGHDVVLDHIQNRAAVRLAGHNHQFIRLCPISSATNTNAGLNNGAEGIEKAGLRILKHQHKNTRRRVEKQLTAPIILADPADLTKMLDIPPGLTELQGVASMLMKYYAR